ncbi:MAG: hypothetical protein ABJB85_11115 [Nitrososphaerota archaeon]
MGCKEISYIVTEYFNGVFYTVSDIDWTGIGPCHKPACDDFRVEMVDIDVQLMHLVYKIPGHKIKARMFKIDKL